MDQSSSMDDIIAACNNPSTSSEQLISVLQVFLRDNLQAHAFVEKYGAEKKTAMYRALLGLVADSKWSNDAIATALQCLRICSREAHATELIAEQQHIKTVLSLAAIDKVGPETLIQEEASKLLANALMHQREKLVPILESVMVAEKALERLKIAASPDMVFPLTRIIFYMAVEESGRKRIAAQGAIPFFVGQLARALKNPKWLDSHFVVLETLKVLFNLTMHLGPLNGGQTPPTEEEVAQFRILIPMLEELLSLPDEPKATSVRAITVNCIINTPYICTPLFNPERVLPALLHLLQLHAREENPSEALTPVLMVLTSIARDIPTARRIIKKVLFPSWNPAAAPESDKVNVEQSATVKNDPGAALFPFMTHPNSGLTYYTNEFIYQLCGEDAQEFVRLTGLGNAAGLLYMRGLFGFGKGLTKEGPMPPPEAQQLGEKEKEQTLTQEQLLQRMEKAVVEGQLHFFKDTKPPPPKP